jgi:hypothetical protein
MTWAGRATATAIAAATLLAAGCGSGAAGGRQTGAAGVAALTIPLDTSVATASGSWATIVMGGSAAQRNNFWQVLERPPGGARWVLVTPPGTADNGGLVLAPGAGQSAFTAFRPSNLLTFTPLSRTADSGQSWSAAAPMDAPLASSPGALAVQPGAGQLLALTAQGAVEQASAGGSWRTVTTARALAASAAARRCGLTTMTTVAYSPAGDILVAGACSKPGFAGLFTDGTGAWRATGPAPPATLSGDSITVLRLVVTGRDVAALLQAGTGNAASLVAAWSATAGRWSLSQPLPLRGAELASAAFGPTGLIAVTTTAGSAALINAGASTWQALPHPPAGTEALASTGGSQVDALAVDRSALTVWQLTQSGSRWQRGQSMTVPIQYGSSG